MKDNDNFERKKDKIRRHTINYGAGKMLVDYLKDYMEDINKPKHDYPWWYKGYK